jgi:hypothetical protein
MVSVRETLQGRMVPVNELSPQLYSEVAGKTGMNASAEAIPSFEEQNGFPVSSKMPGGRQPRDAAADHADVSFVSAHSIATLADIKYLDRSADHLIVRSVCCQRIQSKIKQPVRRPRPRGDP